jgi:uncharacterized protein YecE (DUF72 family)
VASGSDGILYAGSSGFSYREWVGSVYPAGTKPDAYLRLYAECLPALELNTSVYRLPEAEQFARWAEQTPPDFRFAVKLPGFAQRLQLFYERVRALGERLGCVLVQIKAARDDELLDRLLASIDPVAPHAFELRHLSWEDSAVDERLAAAGVVRVGSLEGAAPIRYLRRRDPPWDDAELARLTAEIRPLLARGVDVWTIFNRGETPDHSPGGEPTARTAERLLELIGGAPRRSAPSTSPGRRRG